METGHPSTRAVNSGSGNRAYLSIKCIVSRPEHRAIGLLSQCNTEVFRQANIAEQVWLTFKLLASDVFACVHGRRVDTYQHQQNQRRRIRVTKLVDRTTRVQAEHLDTAPSLIIATTLLVYCMTLTADYHNLLAVETLQKIS